MTSVDKMTASELCDLKSAIDGRLEMLYNKERKEKEKERLKEVEETLKSNVAYKNFIKSKLYKEVKDNLNVKKSEDIELVIKFKLDTKIVAGNHNFSSDYKISKIKVNLPNCDLKDNIINQIYNACSLVLDASKNNISSNIENINAQLYNFNWDERNLIIKEMEKKS